MDKDYWHGEIDAAKVILGEKMSVPVSISEVLQFLILDRLDDIASSLRTTDEGTPTE